METGDIIQLATILIIAPFGWYISKISQRLEKHESLIHRTREEYLSKIDAKSETDRIIEYIQRIEDKIDRMIK